jgi:hypothetical protein
MVVFSIGAHILDTLLIKSVGVAADVALTVVSWGTRSLLSTVWTQPLSEEQQLRIEVLKLKDELKSLESILENTVDHQGDEYILI